MEPLTTLGLVSNIVQLVNAAIDAAKVCHEIYKQGASVEDRRIAYTTDQLHQCYTALSNSLASQQALPPSQNDIDLADLSAKCCQSSQTLHDELKALEINCGGGHREAVTKFILKKRKASKIQKLKDELNEYQGTLDTKVLANLRYSLV